MNLNQSTRGDKLINFGFAETERNLCGRPEIGLIRPGDVRPRALGKPENEHRSCSSTNEDQCAISAGPARSWTRYPLLDQTSAEIGIDLTTMRPSDRFNQRSVRNVLPSGKPLKPSVLEDPHTAPPDWNSPDMSYQV